MVKKLLADVHLNSLKSLEKIYNQKRDYRKRDRLLSIIWSIDEKLSAAKIAIRFRRNEQTIRSWIKQYNKNGLNGLDLSFNGGRKSKLNLDDENFIIDLLDKNPEDYNFLTQTWDCKILAAAYGEKHDFTPHKDVVWRMLKRRGFSYKKPEVMNPKADEELKKKGRRKSSPWKKR